LNKISNYYFFLAGRTVEQFILYLFFELIVNTSEKILEIKVKP